VLLDREVERVVDLVEAPLVAVGPAEGPGGGPASVERHEEAGLADLERPHRPGGGAAEQAGRCLLGPRQRRFELGHGLLPGGHHGRLPLAGPLVCGPGGHRLGQWQDRVRILSP
jgi:hypothetical protein